MNLGLIPDGDNLFRLCTHPISFDSRDRFVPGKVIKIYDEPDGSLVASLAWERLVPTTDLVHAYGCRLSLGINRRAVAKGSYQKEKRSIYCGAYKLRASAVRALPNEVDEVRFADVVHRTESGEIAHTDLRIVLFQRADLNVESTKTAILACLWNVCQGPLRHMCDCDSEVNPHPNLNLDVAPLGEYSDARSHCDRRWSTIRYRALNWMWRALLGKRD
jgi:hypothetical protein